MKRGAILAVLLGGAVAAMARERVPELPRLGTGVAEGMVVLPLREMAPHELRASSIPVLGGLTELRALSTEVPALESLAYQRVASPLWSMVRGPLIRANHAADWLGTIGVFDLPNTNSVPDAVNDVRRLKIISHARGWDATSAKVRAALLAEKGNGYNAVLFEWRVGMNPAPVISQMIWARSRFEKVILAPVVTEAWRVGFFPSVNDATEAMRDLLPHVDAVVLGWGFTIDTVLPEGGPVMETFCAMFFRWCESRAALAGVPTWGNVYLNRHGNKEERYQYTPTNLTAYVCGNLFDYSSKFMLVPPSVIAARLAAEGVPGGRPVILGPFYDDPAAARYNRLGYGVIKMRTDRL